MKSNNEKSSKVSSSLFICSWFCKEPKFIFRVIFLTIASILSIYQFTSCAVKLSQTIDGTFLRVQINQSLYYPAITFCQEPPFAVLDANVSVIDAIKLWETQELIKNITIVDFLSDVGFAKDEVDSVRLGPDQDMKVISSFTLLHGQCHTYIPQTPVNRVGKYFGYNISLTYDKTFPKGDTPFGWHIYIHDAQHGFDDHCTTDGRADYYFLNVGEIVEAKIKPKAHIQNGDCTDERSVAECFQSCIYRKLVKKLECQAPWMNFEGIKICSTDAETFSYLLYFGSPSNSYINEQSCSCPRICSFTNYEIYVEKAAKTSVFSSKRSHLSIYYTTNAITVAEEILLYDFTRFLTDISATLAFFLGLSLISIGSAVEKACRVVFWPKPSEVDTDTQKRRESRTKSWPYLPGSVETRSTLPVVDGSHAKQHHETN